MVRGCAGGDAELLVPGTILAAYIFEINVKNRNRSPPEGIHKPLLQDNAEFLGQLL